MRRLLLLFTLLMASCANPYVKFYRGTKDARTWTNYIPSTAPVAIYGTSHFRRDIDALVRQGYYVVGESSFQANENSVSKRQLLDQAKKIGAEMVLLSTKYAGTVRGVMPLTIPQTSTTYSSGTATAYGNGGMATAYGSGMSTTYTNQTTMVPYAISRADFDAVYLAKIRWSVGILAENLDEAAHQRLQTNAGVLVRVVVQNTPAFRADVLPGDIVLAVNNTPISSPNNYLTTISKYRGQQVTLKVSRNGKIIQKTLNVLSKPVDPNK